MADAYLQEIKNSAEGEKAENDQAENAPVSQLAPEPQDTPPVGSEAPADAPAVSDPLPPSNQTVDESQDDTPDVPIRFAEKKRLHWKGKTCKSSASVLLCSYLLDEFRSRSIDDSGQFGMDIPCFAYTSPS